MNFFSLDPDPPYLRLLGDELYQSESLEEERSEQQAWRNKEKFSISSLLSTEERIEIALKQFFDSKNYTLDAIIDHLGLEPDDPLTNRMIYAVIRGHQNRQDPSIFYSKKKVSLERKAELTKISQLLQEILY